MQESKDILKELGDNIRKVRKSRNMTQLDLEVASGITAGDVSKIENGLINIAFTTLVKLASALDVELNELYNISDNQ
jgi:transcriptional regulator with XRE-family HTH domain